MPSPQILIVGAGPTGLVLALYLAHQNIALRIIDKTDQPGTTSRALGVQARTLEFYDQLHLARHLVDHGRITPGINFWTRGKKHAQISLQNVGQGQSPFPFLLIYPQDEHEKFLIEQLAAFNIHVERRTELLRFTQAASHVDAVLQSPGSPEESAQFHYIAGCDGAHSVVRKTLDVNFPGGTYSQIFYVADVQAAGPAVDGQLHVDLDTSDFLALFPLKAQSHVRLIGTVRSTEINSARNLTFNDVSHHAIDEMKLRINAVNWFSTYHVHHRVAQHFRKDRAFLLGDAAHIHSPVGGQGMNTGIGDAVNLAWKLAAVLRKDAPPALLDTYEPERIAFARRLVNTTDRIFTLATNPSPPARFARTTLLPALAPALFRLRFVRNFLFRTVSQISIHYRKSSLSQGKAGTLRAGDRLPYFPLTDTQSNFSPLNYRTWQIHIYGTPAQSLQQAARQLHLPIHSFPWQSALSNAGFMQNALYLVRPDAHLALVHRSQSPALLTQYLRARELTFPPQADSTPSPHFSSTDQ